MFFNQPVLAQLNENHRAAPQIDFQILQTPVLIVNKISLPSVPLQAPFLFAPQTRQQQQKNGWEIAADILCAVGLGIIIGGVLVLTAEAVAELFRPACNSVPLKAKERQFIRERDDEICFYCDNYSPNGHVDHRVSRYNGGGNEPENLTWACVSCNCSKGAMNDSDYIRLIELYC